jgi:primosomal protein N'
MKDLVAKNEFQVALLDGVTGSGKTEVYFEAVAENIKRGRQTMILMPEIALTGQFLDRFASRFGVRPIEWHSELTPRTRARNWAAVAAGDAPVVVGARSALFLPYADLGLIIVDEEHDQAYKQDEGAHYHARDMAVVRGSIAKIPVVLCSATPSVESEVNARKGRYRRVALPSRFGGQHMPQIEAIDLKRKARSGTLHLSASRKRSRLRLSARNRRCCFSIVVAMRRSHYAAPAGIALPAPFAMHGWWIIAFAKGWSVITAGSRCRARINVRIAVRRNRWPRSVRRRTSAGRSRGSFPRGADDGAVERSHHRYRDYAIRIERDRGRPCRHHHRHAACGKGAQFPAAQSRRRGRCRSRARQRRSARRRTHIPVAQSGDRPRGPEQGRGVGYLQTHQPEHPVMKALVASDREAFYASEIEARERALYPPFGRLASLIISAGDRPTAESFARKLVAAAPLDERVQVLGPAEAPLAVIKGRYRFRILVKSVRGIDLSGLYAGWLAAGPKTRAISNSKSISTPQSFL